MAETVSQLVTDILEEGAFDATSPQALRWLNRRHKQMCARARVYRKLETATRTAAGLYTVPAGLVEAIYFATTSLTYSKGRSVDLPGIVAGTLPLSPASGGIYVKTAAGFTLYPAPEAADTVRVYGAFQPPDLLIDNSVPLRIDDDMVEGLLAGAFATAYSRPDTSRPDLAAPQEAMFSAACDEQRSRENRRMRGSGPRLIRILDVNA